MKTCNFSTTFQNYKHSTGRSTGRFIENQIFFQDNTIHFIEIYVRLQQMEQNLNVIPL